MIANVFIEIRDHDIRSFATSRFTNRYLLPGTHV